MKLTKFIAVGLTATLLSTGVPYAQTAPATPADVEVVIRSEMASKMPEVMALVEALKAEGYTYIEIRSTLLGRAKVMAEGPDGTREVVMSSATGEVMRDVSHDGDHLPGHGGHGEMDSSGDGEHGGMGDGDHDGTGGGMGDGDHDGTGGGMGGGHGGSTTGGTGGGMGSGHGGGTGGGMGSGHGGSTGGSMGGGMGDN